MNKKIEEIAKQCWDERLDGQLHFDCEKFAELIIEKCGEIADNYVDHGIPSSAIDKYFGVDVICTGLR